MTWAEVVKAIGPIESVQYRTSGQADGPQPVTTTVNYVTASAMRVDSHIGVKRSRSPATTRVGTSMWGR